MNFACLVRKFGILAFKKFEEQTVSRGVNRGIPIRPS
jgi:hypothetical protein